MGAYHLHASNDADVASELEIQLTGIKARQWISISNASVKQRQGRARIPNNNGAENEGR
jgi:hypothetical protein